jgi:DNA-3-methyladenine glycosylase I
MMKKITDENRCAWARGDELMALYHDEEWGVPCHDDKKLFEAIVLDAAQAGLSWRTVLYKRENYRKAFDGFDAKKIARYSDARIEKLLTNPGIIRNRQKVLSARTNAQAFLQLQKESGSFSEYLWNWVDGKPIQNAWEGMEQLPATTELSDALSKDLKKRGFKFVGSTIVYAMMQAVGLVNDHVKSCPRQRAVKTMAARG